MPRLTAGELDALVEPLRGQWRQPGIAVTLVQPGAGALARGYGYRRAGDRQAVDADTLFALASCTKPFAAATAGVLVDADGIDLDDRVALWLPDFRLGDELATRELCVRDLLCNRLGLVSSEGRHRRAAADRNDLLQRMRFQPFRHAFRAEYGYCTDAFTVLGAVIEAAAGKPWAEFAAETLWEPLGMRRTHCDHRAARADANSASPHTLALGPPEPFEWFYEDEVAVPAGGMNSCARDLAPWLECLLGSGSFNGRRILSEQSVREQRTLHTPDRGRFRDAEFSRVMGEDLVMCEGYALGWYTHAYTGTSVYYHTGGIDGFRAIIGIVPGAGIGIAVLANSDGPYLPRALFQLLLDRLLGIEGPDWSLRFLAQQRTEAALAREAEDRRLAARSERPAAQFEHYTGSFTDCTGFGEARVWIDDERLVVDIGRLRLHLVHTGGDEFDAYLVHPGRPRWQCLARFVQDEPPGPFTGFTTTQGARFRRVSSPSLRA